VLMGAGFATSRFATQQDTPTSDQLWVKAILHSLPLGAIDTSRAPVFYRRAIAQSDNPGPLCVALGDYLRGPVPASLAFRTALETADVEGLSGEYDKAFEEALSLIEGGDEALAAYLTAIRLSPDNPVSHFRVAVYGQGAIGLQSACWLSQNDPDNALGPYLEAMYALKSNPRTLLELVRKANARPTLRIYDDPLPAHVQGTYPSAYEEIGVAHQSVTAAALRHIMDVQNSMVDLANPLRDGIDLVLGRLYEIANDVTHPDSHAAIAAHQASCHQLIFNQSGSFLLTVRGYLRSKRSFELVQSRFQSGSPAYVAAFAQHEDIERFRKLMHERWDPQYELPAIDAESIFSGMADPVLNKVNLLKEIQSESRTP